MTDKSDAEFKARKDALIDALLTLSRAATEASSATIEFFSSLSDAEPSQLGALTDGLSKYLASLSSFQTNDASPNAATNKRKRVQRKPKDPNAPKRPHSSYFTYLTEARKVIPQERIDQGLPPLNSAEMAKDVAARWHALSEEDKKPWNDIYQRQRENYQKELALYGKGVVSPGNAENVSGDDVVVNTENLESDTSGIVQVPSPSKIETTPSTPKPKKSKKKESAKIGAGNDRVTPEHSKDKSDKKKDKREKKRRRKSETQLTQ